MDVPPQSLSESKILLGPYTIIRVDTGFVAKTSNKGKLEILAEGQYLLETADHVFNEFVSVKQETQKLESVTAYTNDNVGLTIKADVSYQITEPQITISRVNDIVKSIIETAEMCIEAGEIFRPFF